MLLTNDDRSLAMLFHLNSEADIDRPSYHQLTEIEYSGFSGAGLALPPPDDSPVLSAIIARRSIRQFVRRGMPLGQLATLLYGAAGVTGVDNGVHTRAVPSAGGLYPIELYVRTRGVDGLPDAMYHYDVRGHSLEPRTPAVNVDSLEPAMPTACYLKDANAVIFLAGVFARSMTKYGARGYRFVLMEAGHVAQNLCLLAAEAGLASFCVGGFRDAALNNKLGFDGQQAGVVYTIGLGAR
jgi:SagB-type dehydrogenase family enzyme